MKVSLQWLKRYIDLEATPEELETVFPLLGLEVESVDCQGLPQLEKVVVGEVLSREQHPDAHSLGVCMVAVGEAEPVQIVCGASNYKVGDRVPVALVGARLPGNFKIKKSKLRGVGSNGMMCSSSELGMGRGADGLLILEGRPDIGLGINEVFSDGDVVFDLELTANRGDCASHIGVARELAAWYRLELKKPLLEEISVSAETTGNDLLPGGVDLASPHCPYYTAWGVKGVKIQESPDWLKKDLEAIGLQPINNVVDIVNWVMFECGQPMHAFDAAKIGGGKLIVRNARAGEKIKTLDEKEHSLDESIMVVADSQKPLVVAGVMGSLDAEVDGGTQDIVLEAAYFNPGSVRNAARKLGIATDSSYRFSRDVDPTETIVAAERAVRMILEHAGGSLVGPGLVFGEVPRGDRFIALEKDFVRKVFGFKISDDAIKDSLERLGFTVGEKGDSFDVMVPAFRSEVDRPIDLVEECIRIYGTDKIPASLVTVDGVCGKDDPIAVFNHKAGDFLIERGFDETYHYSLRAVKEVEELFGKEVAKSCVLANSLTAEQTHLRPSLLLGLWDALLWNQNQGQAAERFFELGRIWRNGVELVSVSFVLSVDAAERHWKDRMIPDFYTAKALFIELAKLAGIKDSALIFEKMEASEVWQEGHAAKVGDLGCLGLCNLVTTKRLGIKGPVLAGELIIRPDALAKKAKLKRFEPFSHYPISTKDIALVVDAGVLAETVRSEVEAIAKEVVGNAFSVEKVSIFDVYRGKGVKEGEKSLAFALNFRGLDRTLKDNEVMKAFDSIQEKLKASGRYSIRS